MELRGAKVVAARQVQIAEAPDQLEGAPLRGNAAALLAHLRAHGALPVARLAERWSTARTLLPKLAAEGLVTQVTRDEARDPFFRDALARDEAPEPTEPQRAAMQTLDEAIVAGKSEGFLLHGVTGSGKTEVYYFPLVMSEDLSNTFAEDAAYTEKISFMLNLNRGNVFELMRKLGL